LTFYPLLNLRIEGAKVDITVYFHITADFAQFLSLPFGLVSLICYLPSRRESRRSRRA
jgi:hypothetical protein